jgi:hypothetical protein
MLQCTGSHTTNSHFPTMCCCIIIMHSL